MLPTGRHVLGRGAADAGDRSSHDEPPEALDDGRAIDGSLAIDDAAHHVDNRRTPVRRRHDPARWQNAQAALSLANYGYVLEVGKIVLQNTGQALLVDENVRKVYLGED